MEGLGDLLQEFFARGVIVVFRPMHFWAGLLCNVKNHWFCFINSKNPLENQRWTLAHELGHFVLHKEEGGHLFTDGIFCGTEEDAEWQANCFAAEILMPPEAIEAIIPYYFTAQDKVNYVAMEFKVPVKMAAWWLFELGYINKKCYSHLQKPVSN